MFGFIGQTPSEGFIMFLLVKWIMAAETATGACSVSNADTMATLGHAGTWGISWTSSLNLDADEKATRSILGTALSQNVPTLRGEINSGFFHLFFTHSTDSGYLCLGLHFPPLSTSTSLSRTCTHTHTSWGNVRVSIHSAEASCTPGDSPGWWCWLRSGCTEGRGEAEEGWLNGPTGLSFRSCSTCTFQFTQQRGGRRNAPSCKGLLSSDWAPRVIEKAAQTINKDEKMRCCFQFPNVLL